jgi:hypothetical protein
MSNIQDDAEAMASNGVGNQQPSTLAVAVMKQEILEAIDRLNNALLRVHDTLRHEIGSAGQFFNIRQHTAQH